MFSKVINLFKVKEDDTLNFINQEAFQKPSKNHRFTQEEEDAFFEHLEKEDLAIQEESPSPKTTPTSRESTLKKMYACMKERDWNPKHHPKILIGLSGTVLLAAFIAFMLHETPNPLLGKWQPIKKTNIFAPTGEIEFRKDQLLANGVTTPIEYTIESQYVEVVDLNTKMRIPFYITGDKTIELNLLGVKTTYKKMDK
ncbi:hypothetical protein [Sulfurospirillum cavolei]|uniref:hypothetical protein n=1 Tax=Sulfurospirillum cavolei TaxID=366522 RepID=UPI003FA2A336